MWGCAVGSTGLRHEDPLKAPSTPSIFLPQHVSDRPPCSPQGYLEGESRRDSEGGQNKLFLFAHILPTQRGKQKAPNNLAIIPALHGDGSIPLPFVFCHLAVSIMENPPFSPDSHGSEGGCSFSRRIISLNKCTKGRTMWGIWAVCVGDRIPSRSKQTRWRFFGFCLQFSQNCTQLCSGGAQRQTPPGLFFFFLRPGRKLFTADSHRATNICEMARGGAPAFMRGLPEERGFPSASSFSRDNRKARRSGEQGGKKILPAACGSGPRSDRRPSPRRLHVPAGCIEGGMAWTQQCEGAL